MALRYIKDAEPAAPVARVVKRSGVTKTALACERAAAREAELDQRDAPVSSWQRLPKSWQDHPLRGPTGLIADEAFHDEVSGGLWPCSWTPRPSSRC